MNSALRKILAIGLATVLWWVGEGLCQTPFLSFPLPKKTPFTAEITSVFDHSIVFDPSMSSEYTTDDIVVAYTGEKGERKYGACPVDETEFYGFKNKEGTKFVINGNYTGGGGLCEGIEAYYYLFYDGHPGYDYVTQDQGTKVPVLATAQGIAYRGSDAKGKVYIDHENGYRTNYIHLVNESRIANGTRVERGQQIGIAGSIGASAVHLHFSVQKYVGKKWVPVDPYGWKGSGPDPYTAATNVNLWEISPTNVAKVIKDEIIGNPVLVTVDGRQYMIVTLGTYINPETLQPNPTSEVVKVYVDTEGFPISKKVIIQKIREIDMARLFQERGIVADAIEEQSKQMDNMLHVHGIIRLDRFLLHDVFSQALATAIQAYITGGIKSVDIILNAIDLAESVCSDPLNIPEIVVRLDFDKAKNEFKEFRKIDNGEDITDYKTAHEYLEHLYRGWALSGVSSPSRKVLDKIDQLDRTTWDEIKDFGIGTLDKFRGGYYGKFEDFLDKIKTTDLMKEYVQGKNKVESNVQKHFPFSLGKHGQYTLDLYTQIEREKTVPDLTVSPPHIEVEPISVKAGESILVTFTIKNVGNAPSDAFTNRVSLSTTEWGTEVLLGNFDMDSLNGNFSQQSAVEVTIPRNISPRNYYVTVYTDVFRFVDESEEGNNIGSTEPQMLSVIKPPTFDLAVTSVDAPSSANIGETIPISFIIVNQETFSSTPFTNWFFLAITSQGTNIFLGNFDMASLGGGASRQGTMEVTIPTSIFPGDYYITVLTDAFRNIAETDENNNIGSTNKISIRGTGDITPPTAVLGLPNGGEDWAVGTEHKILWSATDAEGITSIDLKFSPDGGATWQDIAIGQANNGFYLWTIPDNVTSNAKVKVIAYDAAGNSGFDESDGIFAISSPSPPLTIPTLYDPGILSESGNFHISWSKVSGADRYTLEEDTDASFSSPVLCVTTDASKYISGKRNDVYYYRVKAENEFGSSSWSNVVDMEVRVNSAPNVPSNPSPPNGATSINRDDLTFSWSGGDPDGPVDYAVLLGTDPSDLTAYRGFGSGQTGEFFKLPFTLGPARTYYWQVKAKDNKGLVTTGPIWNFTTAYSYPDIVPTNLTITGTIAPDAQVTLNLTVENQGTFTASPCEVLFYYSSTSTGRDERFGNRGTTIPELSPGAQATVTETVTLDHLRAGQSYVVAEINTQGCFIEGNLNNNIISYSINYQDDTFPTITYLNLRWGSGPDHDRFKTGYSYNIVFTIDDDIGIESLDFYYSIDDGTTWSVITTGFVIGSNGFGNSYRWTIPPDMPLITTGKIKMIVRDTSGNTSVGTTDTFTIIDGSAPDITVLSPNGGEVWDLGSQHEITWEASSPNGIEEVRIYLYWSDTADIITYQAGNVTSYMWTLPTTSSFVTNTARIKIRVVDGNGNEAEDWSDDYFAIRDVSELPPAPWATPVNISNTSRESLYPDGVVDSQDNIHVVWNDFTGSTLYGNIYYAKCDGSSWSRPINISHTDGVKNIKNPVAIVLDSFNSLHVVWTDYSTNPNNGEIYYIKWDEFSWSSPINISSNSGDSQSPRIAIDSSNNLHIVWFDNSSGGYKLFYRKHNGVSWLGTEQISHNETRWADIAVDSLNSAHVVWQGANLDIDPDYEIYYRKWDGSWQTEINVSKTLGATSYIPRITIDLTGNLHVVWYDYTPGNYDIYYAKFNGSSWSPNTNITNSTDHSEEPRIAIDSLEYPHVVWREHGATSLVCHACWNGNSWSSATRINRTSDYPEHPALSISSTDRLQVFWSNGYGEILYNYADVSLDMEAPIVTLTSPAGGEQLSIGETCEIRWNASDNVGVSSISLKYTTDGESFTEIASRENNDGDYLWDVPNIVSDTVQIWVIASDATGNQGVAISGYFSISDQTAPNVSLTSPNGGETWMVESQHDITWSATDNVEVVSIDLFYSTDAGNSWLSIAKDEPNDGTYSWTIPYNLSSDCKIRVVAYDSSSQMSADVSDGTFSITTANKPPYTPHSPVPADGSANVCITIELAWIGGDPDSEDVVAYDIYLGTGSSSMNLISDDQPNSSYTLSTLKSNTTYYWQIIASDGKESSHGPIWSFTTGTENINAPSNLSAVTISNNQIDLSWEDNSDNEEGFKIERKKETDETYSEIAVVGPDSCTYSNVGLNGGTTYIYRVRAYYGSVHSVYSNEASAATVNSPPNTPAVLLPLDDATNQAISSVVLKWQGGDPDSGDTVTYDLYFGTSTGPPLVSGGQSDTTYSPGTLDYHKFYFWKIVAFDNHGVQTPGPLWSFATEPEPLPEAPDSLIVVSISGDRIELRWNDNSGNETGFKIERRVDEGVSIQIYSVGSNVTTHSDTGLADGTTYHYRIRAYNASGNSEYSDIVSATTPLLDILGDVDNSRVVNITDALIVATYELDPSITIPNGGKIELGDVNRDELINVADALMIATYDLNPENPYLPLGIGQPISLGKLIAATLLTEDLYPEGSIVIKLSASNSRPSLGETIVIAINIDMAQVEEKLGAYSAILRWNPKVLEYAGYEGGNTEGFDHPLVMEGEVDKGRLKFNQFNPEGASGQVNIINVTFVVKEKFTSSSLEIELSSLTAAHSFLDLLLYTKACVPQEMPSSIPESFSLSQNYPNPFNFITAICYDIPVQCIDQDQSTLGYKRLDRTIPVVLKIYNTRGQLVRILVKEEKGPGKHVVRWDGRDNQGFKVGSGIYIYRLRVGNFRDAKKMVMIR